MDIQKKRDAKQQACNNRERGENVKVQQQNNHNINKKQKIQQENKRYNTMQNEYKSK